MRGLGVERRGSVDSIALLVRRVDYIYKLASSYEVLLANRDSNMSVARDVNARAARILFRDLPKPRTKGIVVEGVAGQIGRL